MSGRPEPTTGLLADTTRSGECAAPLVRDSHGDYRAQPEEVMTQPPPAQQPTLYGSYFDPQTMPNYPPIPPTKPGIRTTNHVLHLLLALITCGLWIPFWVLTFFQNDKLAKSQKDWYEQAMAEYTQANWLWEQQHRR